MVPLTSVSMLNTFFLGFVTNRVKGVLVSCIQRHRYSTTFISDIAAIKMENNTEEVSFLVEELD